MRYSKFNAASAFLLSRCIHFPDRSVSFLVWGLLPALVLLLAFAPIGLHADQTNTESNTLESATSAEASNENDRTNPATTAANSEPEVAAGADAWTLYRGDSFGTGQAASSLPAKLEVLWRHEVENGSFVATPVIANGSVFLGDLDGHVFGWDLATGKELWQQKVESGFVASPAWNNERLYLGDYDGNFYCFDANTGELQWKFASEAEVSAGANFYQGQVIFASQDANLYCLDATTGKLSWKHTLEDQVQSYPTIVNGKCFVAGCDRLLHVLDIKTGNDELQVDIGAPTCVTPAVLGNQVVFGTEAGEVLAVDWQAGEVQWRFRDGRRRQSIRSCPALSEQLVVIGSRNKRVYGLNLKTGAEEWVFATRSRIDSAPVIVGDKVYIGGGDGRLYGLELKTGKKFWEYETGSSFTGSPAIASQKLVIANEDGVVYAFGAK